MTDIFAIRSQRQRQIVVGALLVYVALFVTELSTTNPYAGPLSDLLIGVLVLLACGVGTRRISRARETEPVAVALVATLGIAGLSIAYQGLAGFELVPQMRSIDTVGSFALLVAVGLYFYDQYA
ncbi:MULTISPECIES: hypothetical protein [Halomicrobium]|uniref:Uncharacterized protein n=2 Tax=Halomicrobium mukohataei TaxID=57705 RepID=C7P2I3_HALMD|nr:MULTISPECIES: hypothetical protein [Halomicrobium]ACV49298.1 hypothetical protein Hmuk_3193 [Halomicrobium mukohataei DSM 12286]QCD64696.1 hypothetical protein E5139_03195 [Halomicrobium mukohataei]QFR19503.1 hypothetical protein GBQ70_03195 [Halomicrobium sp. ZPS1]